MGAHEQGYRLSDAEKAFIRKSYDNCAAFITICGGMQAALEAGLLEGKTATAPRPMVEMLRQAFPGVKWVEKRWAHDEKLWTSGALLNGTDLMRAFVTEHWKGPLFEFALELGHYPIRDVNYADAPGKL
jgi:transcriptional regulator GlxA family with amidase domain